MDIKIRKAKISKSGLLEVSYIDQEGNDITMKGKNKCHNDLRVAFSRLVPYFADLTEQKEADRIDWSDLNTAENIELLRVLDVNGISMGSDDAFPIITLTGKRNLRSTQVLNLNSPGVDINSDTLEWPHVNEFDSEVQALIYEVKEYILNKKWEEQQMQIDFDANPDDPFAGVGTGIEDISIEIETPEVAEVA